MLTSDQYNTAVFTAMRANAALTETLRAKEALGCYPKWNLVACQDLKIQSGLFSLEIQDYSSDASVDIYNQLLEIGSTWFGGIAFNPNAQNPIIEIINVLSTPSPRAKIEWSEFDSATQDPDGNRYILYQPTWKGFNPLLTLDSPAQTALTLGEDYQLLTDGGIQILVDLSGAGSPGIADGQRLRADSYEQA